MSVLSPIPPANAIVPRGRSRLVGGAFLMDIGRCEDDRLTEARRCPECGGLVACLSGCESCLCCGHSRCCS